MESQEIAVNTATLQRDANEMKEALGRVKARTDRMFDEIKALDSMWEGEAHQAFARQFNYDYQKMKELCDTISNLIECMQYAKREYVSCENTIGSIINSIRI